jgi:hypothetical protein
MPNWNAFDGDEEDNNGQDAGPKALRDRLKSLEKENRELKEQNTTLSKRVRTTSVSDVVKAKGYNPKVAALIPADIEASEDAIGKWLEEFADVFSLKKTEETPATTAEVEDASSDDGSVGDDVADALSAIANVSSSSITPTRQSDLLKQINDPNLSQDKFLDLLRANGVQV